MYKIRKAVPEDALGIAIVNVYTWKTTYTGLMPNKAIDERIGRLRKTAERMEADIRRDGNFIVAAAGDTVVGSCIYGKSRNESFGDSGEIFAIYVLKGFQGTGIGKALLLAGAKELLAQSRGSMIVNCLRGNPSLGFYKHMGGKSVGQRQDDIAGGRITEDIVLFEDLAAIVGKSSKASV